MAVKTVIEAIREAMAEEMRRDDKVFILGEDVGKRGGVFLSTQGFLEEFGEKRVIDTPLAEASIMGIALGAAYRGLRPIPGVQFSDFVWPSVNQLIGEAARVCYGTNGNLNVPMVVRIPYGGGVRGGLFHSQNVESLFFHTPGLKVVTPATPYDAKGLLKSAIRDNNPVIFLEHKKTYRLVRGEVPEEEYTLPLGTADVKRAGSTLTLVSYGLMLHYALQAADTLAEQADCFLGLVAGGGHPCSDATAHLDEGGGFHFKDFEVLCFVQIEVAPQLQLFDLALGHLHDGLAHHLYDLQRRVLREQPHRFRQQHVSAEYRCGVAVDRAGSRQAATSV